MSPKPAQPKPTPPEAPLSYEQSVAELAEIVRQLESGDVPLSSAMDLWERGEALAASCTQWLEGAKARIEAASSAADVGPDEPNR